MYLKIAHIQYILTYTFIGVHTSIQYIHAVQTYIHAVHTYIHAVHTYIHAVHTYIHAVHTYIHAVHTYIHTYIQVTECKLAGEAVLNLLQKDIKPRDIMTRKAFENAITLVMVGT